jgi:hypothetical protein
LRLTRSPQPAAQPAATTSDPQLKAIDNVAVLTLQNCMQEVFEDGPKRDRRLWLGDLRLQALVNDVTFATTIWSAAACTCLPGIPGKTAWYPPMSSCSRMSCG